MLDILGGRMEKARPGRAPFPFHHPEQYSFGLQIQTLPLGQSLAVKPPSLLGCRLSVPLGRGLTTLSAEGPYPHLLSLHCGRGPLHGCHLGSQSQHQGPFQPSSVQITHQILLPTRPRDPHNQRQWKEVYHLYTQGINKGGCKLCRAQGFAAPGGRPSYSKPTGKRRGGEVSKFGLELEGRA